MDDPIFDPWSREPPSPAHKPPQTSRWRSADAVRPTVPELATPAATPIPRPASAAPRLRLAGTPGFLRTMAVPRLQDMAQRLAIAHHDATVEDMLDGSSPVVTFSVRPWQGPLEADRKPLAGQLELGVEAVDGVEHVAARYTVEPASETPFPVERVPSARFSAAWLEGRTLALVSYLLNRA